MSLKSLREEVWEANLGLVKNGLVVLNWGNASGVDRDKGVVAIKPSGVDYATLKPEDLVIVDLDGLVVDGPLRPSSDTPTHLALYRAWPGVGGVVHTHSIYATMFAQACRPIPCLGTTHADSFRGYIPLTRMLEAREVADDYEFATGAVILERFDRMEPAAPDPEAATKGGVFARPPEFAAINPDNTPAVLVAGHGPFAWGTSASAAAVNALILEQVAHLAYGTLKLAPAVEPLPEHIVFKHYERKHGPGAYYGQQR